MTDRKPALRPMPMYNGMNEHVGMWLRSSDIPPAILNATAEELGAAILAIEQFRETQARAERAAALAAAKSTTAEDGK